MDSPRDVYFDNRTPWGKQSSRKFCFHCGNPILNEELKDSQLDNGKFVHSECQRDLEKMDRD